MKEKDFDDIGKRLHGMEADPPRDGWKKIRPALHEGGKPGRWVWLRKNGWILLILLIPGVIFWFQSHRNDQRLITSAVPSANSAIDKKDSSPLSSTSSDSISDAATIPGENRDPLPVDRESLPAKNENSKPKGNEGNTVGLISVVRLDAGVPSGKESEETEMTRQRKDETGQQTFLDNTEILISDREPENKAKQDDEPAIVAHPQRLAPDTNQGDSSTSAHPIEKMTHATDTAQLALSKEEKEKKKSTGPWRMSAVLAPQFVSNTIKPLMDDEVLITEFDQGKSTQQMGLGLAWGVGKAITPHFYLDGQLSYTFLQQDLTYTFTDGIVDTLITVQQADMTYLVSPVYQTQNREVSARYGYAGIRIAGTYYFWSGVRSRFNLTGALGAHYLLSARVKEKINGEWVSLENENLNTMNYSFSAGAGYNIGLGKNWELMINPTLTWYLKEVKNQSVPFSLREEAWGLNIMLSKTLGR